MASAPPPPAAAKAKAKPSPSPPPPDAKGNSNKGGADLLDLLAYFEDLDPQRRSELYHSPWTCLAVFRNLPPLPRTYIMRILYLDGPFSKGTLRGRHP